MKKITSQFKPEDTCNGDESGFIPSVPPDATLCSTQMSGKKKSKKRITAYFVCNATGTDEREVLFIGKSKQPRCFRKKKAKALGFYYRQKSLDDLNNL